jgi:hypothetical protein
VHLPVAPQLTDKDGSKHIGQFAREHGRFGSMPKYDDYSEEGSAE